jgi:integrase
VIREDRKFWSYRYRLGGTETELSLGAYPEVSLDQARAIHAEKRVLVLKGEDPQEGKRSRQRKAAALAAAQATTPTFGDMAEKYIAAHEGAWKNPKPRQQWRSTIATYCGAFLSTPVNQIDTDTVLAALEPIWNKKPETARRVRGRIEKVLGAARSRGHIDKNQGNAAIWRDHLEHNLPKTKKLVRGHHKALDYKQVPAFMAYLRTRSGVSASALELLVLTAARSGEVFGMKWDEVDFDHAVTVKGPDDKDQTVAVPLWVVPAERMKMGKEHRVPLSEPALAILKAQFEARGDRNHVFPGARPKAPLSTMSFEMILRRMKLDCTVHGFRSSFRD